MHIFHDPPIASLGRLVEAVREGGESPPEERPRCPGVEPTPQAEDAALTMAASNTFRGGGGGFRGGGGGRNDGRGGGGRNDGGGGGGRNERGGGGGSGLPREILARLSNRRKNSKVVSLDFKVPTMPSLPSEDEVWEWLGELNLTDDETHELKYIEREIIETKVYVCMKEESGADHLRPSLSLFVVDIDLRVIGLLNPRGRGNFMSKH